VNEALKTKYPEDEYPDFKGKLVLRKGMGVEAFENVI
jgi:hypothetical protein